MTNQVRQFKSISGVYSGGYTSETLYPTGYRPKTYREYIPLSSSGVIQVFITSGDLALEARLSDDAPWMIIKTWTSSAIEELVLAYQMRIVVSDEAKAWLGENV